MSTNMHSSIVVVVEPVTVDKPTACQMLGIGMAMLEEMMRAGEINARKLRSRTVFAVEDLKAYARNLPSWEPRG